VTGDVEQILGRKATSFEKFSRDYAGAFRKEGSGIGVREGQSSGWRSFLYNPTKRAWGRPVSESAACSIDRRSCRAQTEYVGGTSPCCEETFLRNRVCERRRRLRGRSSGGRGRGIGDVGKIVDAASTGASYANHPVEGDFYRFRVRVEVIERSTPGEVREVCSTS